MDARAGAPAGLCVVRVTRLSHEEVLIIVTTKLDVGGTDRMTPHRVTGRMRRSSWSEDSLRSGNESGDAEVTLAPIW